MARDAAGADRAGVDRAGSDGAGADRPESDGDARRRRRRLEAVFGDAEQRVTSDELPGAGERLTDDFWKAERPPHW